MTTQYLINLRRPRVTLICNVGTFRFGRKVLGTSPSYFIGPFVITLRKGSWFLLDTQLNRVIKSSF